MNSLDGKLYDYATQRTRRDELLSRVLLWASAGIALGVFGWLWSLIP